VLCRNAQVRGGARAGACGAAAAFGGEAGLIV